MQGIKLNPQFTNKTHGAARLPVFEAAEVSQAESSCPFRATCGSSHCDGDWTKPDCPGAERGM